MPPDCPLKAVRIGRRDKKDMTSLRPDMHDRPTITFRLLGKLSIKTDSGLRNDGEA